jgi:hypothetical protein
MKFLIDDQLPYGLSIDEQSGCVFNLVRIIYYKRRYEL